MMYRKPSTQMGVERKGIDNVRILQQIESARAEMDVQNVLMI